MANKIKVFLKQNEAKIALVFGFILVAAISFEFGLIQGKSGQDKPLMVEKPVVSQNLSQNAPSETASQAQNSAQDAKFSLSGTDTQPQNIVAGTQDCAYVGSKNSNKYHLPTCHFAKLIKPENLVCFKSAQDAQSKGYQPDKSCIK